MTRRLRSAVRRNWRTLFVVVSVAADSISLWDAAGIAYWLRLSLAPAATLTPEAFLDAVLMSWALFIFFASLFGLYRAAYHALMKEQLSLGMRAYLFTIPFALSLIYLLHWQTFPRGFVFLFFIFLPVTFLTGRVFLANLNRLLQKAGYGTFNALIVGYDGNSRAIIETYERNPQLGCSVKGVIADPGSKPAPNAEDVHSGILRYPLGSLSTVIRSEEIDRVLIPAVDDRSRLTGLLSVCREMNIDLKILSPTFDTLWRFPFVHDVAGIPLYSRRRRKTERLKRFAKRGFDIVGSVVGLIVLLPVFVFVPLAIILEDGFPVFFRQKRALAQGKSEIEVIKFRSMKSGSEKVHADFLKHNKSSGGLFFMEADPRVTRVGRFLRKFSIDELPQLVRVLTGAMSLVGPRPLALHDLENVTPENSMQGFYELRGRAKPGMTGLWQISGRREVDFREMVLLDLYYIENQSIMFDIEILSKTVPVVLFGKGAY